MGKRENLLEYVSGNWTKIPCLCCMSEERINEFLKSGRVEQSEFEEGIEIFDGEENAEIRVSSNKHNLTAKMYFDEQGSFCGNLYGDINMDFSFDNNGNVEFRDGKRYVERDEVLNNLIENKTVVTHFGDDLDNKASIYAIEKFLRTLGVLAKDEHVNVDRVPAGQIKEGLLNVDTGGHKGNAYYENGTIVIDGNPQKGVMSACQALANVGIYVPAQICELADSRPNQVSALDSRSGLALARYLSGEQLFRIAEENLLDKSLSDEELKRFGLFDAHLKQKEIIDKAEAQVKKYTSVLPDGQPIVLAPERILGGSAIAYELGIPYYVSTNQRFDGKGNPDGVTFSISCKPGYELPNEIVEYGNALVEKYAIDDKSSNVFMHPNGQLIVAGSPKNPDFKIEGYTAETMLDEIKDVLKIDRYFERIDKLANKKLILENQIKDAEKLMTEYNDLYKNKESKTKDKQEFNER